jgi:hypothetical protein
MPSVQDYTTPFNANNSITIDVSNLSFVTIQFISASGTINFTGSNDNATFATVQGTKLADGTAVTAGATGLFKIASNFKYLKVGGASAAATSVFVFFS